MSTPPAISEATREATHMALGSAFIDATHANPSGGMLWPKVHAVIPCMLALGWTPPAPAPVAATSAPRDLADDLAAAVNQWFYEPSGGPCSNKFIAAELTRLGWRHGGEVAG